MVLVSLVFIIVTSLQILMLHFSSKVINYFDKSSDKIIFNTAELIVTGLFGGAGGAVIFVKYGISALFAQFCIIALILNVIGLIDFKSGNVYLFIDIILLATGTAFNILSGDPSVFDILISGTLMLSICVVSKLLKGMNWGDVEVFTVLAFILGYKAFSLMFLSMVIAGILSLINCIARHKSIFSRTPLCHCIALGYIAFIFVQ